jgi:glycosyltransferase involved in cell wall biosynthesis
MSQLMISLDKRIFDPSSLAARRMVEYGEKDQLYIIVPSAEKKEVELSQKVKVLGSGGKAKPFQFWNLYQTGRKFLQKNKVDLITTQDPFFTGLLGIWLKRKFYSRLEVQVHGDFYGSSYYRQSGLLNRVRYYLGRYVLNQADHVRVVGLRTKDGLVSLGIPREKIEVRPIAVNVLRIQSQMPSFKLADRFPGFTKLFLVAGRLDPVKNIAWLLQIFKRYLEHGGSSALIILGEGKEKERLVTIAHNLGIDKNVFFEPWTDDPVSYVKGASAVVFPSLSEGYGLVVCEARAAGIPIIMTDVGVANYELKPSERVKIIPVGDSEAFIAAMLKI